MRRAADRGLEEIRPTRIVRGVLEHAEGSAFIQMGNAKVLAAASVEEGVPPFLRDSGQGWITAEYSMLPRSTHTRSKRERGGRLGGRTMEIQRLIGRSLRSVTSLKDLGEVTITVDCDVLQADGGTRCASISAGWVALKDALDRIPDRGINRERPLLDTVTAISVGIVDGRMILDLDYSEDSRAEVDMNLVMTGTDNLIEVQATAEGAPFSLEKMNSLIELAGKGIAAVRKIQLAAFDNSQESGDLL
jgi:ribonuclease PH